MHRFAGFLAIVSIAGLSIASTRAGVVPEPLAYGPGIAAALDGAGQLGSGQHDGDAPSVSVAVVENGRIVYAKAFGLADVATGTAATAATRYRIASITKMFTAVCVMQLVEQGRLSLDDTLSKYVPEYTRARAVTIRELLMHTSGVPNYLDAAFADGSVNRRTTPTAIIASVSGKPLDFAPGTRYEYSNTGYVLLGMIVEGVSGASLTAYENKHIFIPAGMPSTTVGDAPPGTPEAVGYMDHSGTPADRYDASWLFADGDIVSTASDLARFDMALMAGKLVRPKTLALMQSTNVSMNDGKYRYGLGLTLAPFDDKLVAGHHGGVPGFETDNELIASDGFATVVLGNAFDFLTPTVEDGILAAFYPAASARAIATVATPAPAATGEDPAITARFKRFFAGLQQGTIDPSALSQAMRDALTPEALAAMKAQFGPLGPITSLVYRGLTPAGAYEQYGYQAAFGTKRVTFQFVLDKDGKIAGFGL
jgi:CubicO group peptidase (beta-lactamase class C family)